MKKGLLITSFLVFCFGFIMFGTKKYLAIENNTARYAFVFNKTDHLLSINYLNSFENYHDNISIYADLKKIDENKIYEIILADQTGETKALAYQKFADLQIGKSYLFHGYIEMINGENQFIIEKIDIL